MFRRLKCETSKKKFQKMMAMSNNPFLNNQLNNVSSSAYNLPSDQEFHPSYFQTNKQVKQYWEPENQFNFNNSTVNIPNMPNMHSSESNLQSFPCPNNINNNNFNNNFYYRESNYVPNIPNSYYTNEIVTQNEYYQSNMNDNQVYQDNNYQSNKIIEYQKLNNQNIEYIHQTAPIQPTSKPDYQSFNISPSSSPYQNTKNNSPIHSPNNNNNNNNNNAITNNDNQINSIINPNSPPNKANAKSPFSHFQIKKQTNYFLATPKAVKELENNEKEIQEINSSAIDTSKLSDKEKMKPNLKKFKFSNKYNYSIISSHENKEQFFDITEYLNLPQSVAAKKLQIPASTLSKRWRESTNNRKWPWRTVKKIDKEIVALLQNVSNKMASEVEANIVVLLKKREEELKTAVIRL